MLYIIANIMKTQKILLLEEYLIYYIMEFQKLEFME